MSAQGLLPRRVYRGALGAKRRYFAHKLPLALGAERATFVFVQAEDATASAVRTWGKQDAGPWVALAATGRAVEVAGTRTVFGRRGGWSTPGQRCGNGKQKRDLLAT